jgi:uncharacterized protein YegJ (DUF2314 family)
MKTFFIILGVMLFVGFVLRWFLRRRAGGGEERPITALVFLLKEPRKLADWQVRQAAAQVLKLEFKMADSPEPGHIMAVPAERIQTSLPEGSGMTYLINTGEHRLMINSFTRPYMEDPAKYAENITDLRLQRAVAAHQAWISADLFGQPESAKERGEIYSALGQLLAHFADEDCLAIYCPELERCNEYAPEVVEQLKSGQPLEIFGQPTHAPVVNIAGDDPRMVAAVAEAKNRWPEFVAAFSARPAEADAPFIVKARFNDGENEEFMWVSVTAISGGTITGKLENSPAALTNVKLGDEVHVALTDLNDWLCQSDGKTIGGFTVKLMNEKISGGQ